MALDHWRLHLEVQVPMEQGARVFDGDKLSLGSAGRNELVHDPVGCFDLVEDCPENFGG